MATGFLRNWIIFRPTYLRLDLDSNDRVINADLLEYETAAATF
jgi:hypothetical protein